MSPSSAQLVLASPSDNWTKIILIAIFTAGLVAVILVPYVTDVRRAHAAWDKLVESGKAPPQGMEGPTGIRGVARATMAFAVLAVIGFALVYIIVEKPFRDNRTVVGTIIVALTTTLAAITAFYFGSKQATDARAAAPPEDKAGKTKP